MSSNTVHIPSSCPRFQSFGSGYESTFVVHLFATLFLHSLFLQLFLAYSLCFPPFNVFIPLFRPWPFSPCFFLSNPYLLSSSLIDFTHLYLLLRFKGNPEFFFSRPLLLISFISDLTSLPVTFLLFLSQWNIINNSTFLPRCCPCSCRNPSISVN